jgi:hypothetical protein
MRHLPPIKPPLTLEQSEMIAIWIAANDQAWIRDIRRAANGDWIRLNQRVALLAKPQYAIEDDAAMNSSFRPKRDGSDQK